MEQQIKIHRTTKSLKIHDVTFEDIFYERISFVIPDCETICIYLYTSSSARAKKIN